MPPEQIEGRLDELWHVCFEDLPDRGIKAELLGLVREAVLAERERCARVVAAPPGCVCDAREDWCSCGAVKSLDELAGFVREGEGS